MSNKSFTLIEIIVAIFLITIGAGGAFAVIQRTTAFTSITSSRLAAVYLAQEGIEISRNIRDTNWLKQRTNPGTLWDGGLSSSDWEVINMNGEPTKFQRRVIITPGTNMLEVLVEVRWSERERTHQVAAQENLYNWR